MEPSPDVRLTDALTDALTEWRRDHASLLPEERAELEDHLLLSLDARLRLGEDPKTAFEAARASLGSPARLASEFRAASTPRDAARRLIQEIDMKHSLALAIAFAAILLSATTYLSRNQAPRYQLDTTADGRTVRLDSRTGELCRIPAAGLTDGQLICWETPSAGPSESMSTLSGRIMAREGQELAQALVTVDGDDPRSQVQTDPFGRFSLKTRLEGTQVVRVIAQVLDFQGRIVPGGEFRVEGVELSHGKVARLDFTVPDERTASRTN
jgi:hypothetical protein